MQIYIHHNNQQLGPFTEAEIKAHLASGAVSLQDHVWWQGQANWIPLGNSPFASGVSASGSFSAAPAPTPSASAYPPRVERTSVLAICSLVCSFVCCFLSIPAVILGHLALAEMKKDPLIKGQGLAITGLILGYLGIAFLLFRILAVFILIGLGSQVKNTFQAIQSEQHAPTDPSDDR